jgi:hypothetical protein
MKEKDMHELAATIGKLVEKILIFVLAEEEVPIKPPIKKSAKA